MDTLLGIFIVGGVGIGILSLVLGVMVLATLLRGYVLSWLWLWFIVPLGLREISVVHAIGISILIAMLTRGLPKTTPKPTAEEEADPEFKARKAKASKERLMAMVISPLIALAIGYVVHVFM
jgi:hypothetical protein